MIPLGPGPIPLTSAELRDRLADGLRRTLAPQSAAGFPVDADLVSAQAVAFFRVDITGVDISRAHDVTPRGITQTDAATLESLTVTGLPAMVRGLPVTLTADAANVPFTWVRVGDDLWVNPEDGGDQTLPASAHIVASVEAGQLEQFLRAEIEQRVTERGFKLKGFTMDVVAEGPRGVSVRAEATVGKSILSAKVTVTGRAVIDESMTLVLSDIELSSGNPVVSAVIGQVSSRLAPWNDRRIDLASYTFAGARLQHVAVSVDSSVRVAASFGS